MPDGFHSNRKKMSPKLLSELWSEGSVLFYIRKCEVLPLYDGVFFRSMETVSFRISFNHLDF